MFDEYFHPPTIVVSPVLIAVAPRAVDIAYSLVSTSINQGAPSTSILSTQEQEHSLITSQGFKESPKHHIFLMIHFMNLFMKTRLLKDHHRIDADDDKVASDGEKTYFDEDVNPNPVRTMMKKKNMKKNIYVLLIALNSLMMMKTASLTEFELKNILLDKIQKSKSYRGAQEHKDLYDALVKSYKLDKDLFESYGKVYSLKRDIKDKDEDPPAGSDQVLKKQNTSKDAEPSRGSKFKESKSSSSKGSKCQPKSSGKSAQEEEPVFEVVDTEMPLNQGDNVVTDRLDWTNPKGHEYTFDLSKPLPLIKDQGRQVVPANYFINNNLEYLKGGSLSRKYTTSTTKTKAAKYDIIKGIEDMVLLLWIPVKSKHDAFTTKRIIPVTHIKVMKWYDYGYLEEIIVRREDRQLYKFKEGD
nr:hypothetical protein [Tanacetum cinerariifolium]